MRTSPVGLALIKRCESLRLKVYKDAAGLPTIGYGHKLLPGETFSNGITEPLASVLLQEDVDKVDAAMNAQHLALDLNQNQWDAVSSFTFECGAGALVKLLAHGIDQIPAQLPRWKFAKVDGVETDLPGMVTRRAAEVELYNTIPT